MAAEISPIVPNLAPIVPGASRRLVITQVCRMFPSFDGRLDEDSRLFVYQNLEERSSDFVGYFWCMFMHTERLINRNKSYWISRLGRDVITS